MYSRLFRLSCVALGLTCFWTAAVAATTTDLSGKWKLNVEKSTFGLLPAPLNWTANITHRDPALKVETTEETPDGPRSQVLEYTTDSKKCTNKVRDREFRSVLHWDGPVLVIETEGLYEGDPFRAVDHWTMSLDGKTITIERHASNAYSETNQSLILEKP
ncbi:MAG TPA: hypothetical protein VJ723_16335 [Candidatus Angelobacter sp.]|nr:hypothetical protein [Candidatus Angelobacter sp.]